jgi:uracil-DNA glycosylase
MKPLRVDDALAKQIEDHISLRACCKKCGLHATANRKVHVRGQLPCDVLFLGEGPGKTEDIKGFPFVGKAGKLADLWVEAALKKRRFRFAFINLVACRPCDKKGGPNRPPTEEEMLACKGRRTVLVSLASPKVIVNLGELAKSHRFYAWPTLNLPHPAYVLRMGGEASSLHRKCIRRLRKFLRRNRCGKRIKQQA